MSLNIYFRIVGYTITIGMHITNMVTMILGLQGDVLKDPGVRHFAEMQVFFFTCWNFIFQIIFAALSLCCDVLTLVNTNKEFYKPPKLVVEIRKELFSVLIWPASIFVSTFFWAFFHYDRNLLYPANIDKAITSTSNHIMHTFILAVVLWEVMFNHRTEPNTHAWRIMTLILAEVTYIIALLYVYKYHGVWVYPIFSKLNGTVFFPLFFVTVAFALFFIYHLQWYLYSVVWSPRKKLLEENIHKDE